MVVQIAVIGSEKMVHEVIRLNQNKRIYIKPFIYEKPEEGLQLVEEAKDYTVLFFTGPIPYYMAKGKIQEYNLPAVYIPFDELAFSLSLYHIQHAFNINPLKLSIDIPKKEVVYNILHELRLDIQSIFIKEFEDEINQHRYTDEIVQFHYDLWKKGETSFVLTSVQSVYSELQKLNIPSFRMMIPRKNMIATLEQAVTIGELLLSKSSQIAVGIVQIAEQHAQKHYDVKELKVTIYGFLTEFARKMNASVKTVDEHTFMIYGTRGGVEQLTDQYRVFPLLNHLKEINDVNINFGFGFGITVTEAEEHAQIGLYHAKKLDEHSVFIVTEEKKVIGPLNKKITKTFELQSQDERILAMAKKTGISVSSISKIVNFTNLRHNHSFSASDLADYLQLSRRSAERMLKTLVEKNYAEISGEEQPYQKGRPRSIYKINL
ncbi:hypothetical protein AM501_28840 [Aneurinibacillus migulanus]|uniref:hypothetical protein n=1 Tax=Aneurinibacillus migulanus TaxID=47500 RepID=UPI0005B81B17|nr:hypothetical protein [Aneurinibacillus migulanus]KIV52631.1 hypothetical protein TS64_21665 [Aneurinibacillus migulanus]KPD04910.1 hypothetical protein AM501_28840 [Aneurinibacillus migulanus]CEH31077.1 Uncharacterized protein BN1090_A2_03541 [Aneurinibacillus migulanus]